MTISVGTQGEDSFPLVSISQPGPVCVCVHAVCMCVCMHACVCVCVCVCAHAINALYQIHAQSKNSKHLYTKDNNGIHVVLTIIYIHSPISCVLTWQSAHAYITDIAVWYGTCTCSIGITNSLCTCKFRVLVLHICQFPTLHGFV